MSKLLVIDNYDSFTYNLVQMFMVYGLFIKVCRSDRITLHEVSVFRPDYILISPGPKDPAHAGISTRLIKFFYKEIPILGVCLGMQCINEVFGGKTVRANVPMHGKTSDIHHNSSGILQGVPSPFTAARYHSLMVEPGQNQLLQTAHATDGTIMGQSHPEYPLHGIQFHPESFLTQNGRQIIDNFLKIGIING